MIKDILLNLLANGIALIIGIFFGRAYALFPANNCRKFWRQICKDNKIYVTASSVPTQATTKEYRRPATGLGEIQAYASVHESLLEARISQRLRSVDLSDGFPAEGLRCNVVTIGGSQLNRVTERFLGAINLSFQVINDPPKRVISHVDSSEYCPILENKTIKVDYGILTFMKNPYNKAAHIIVLQGAHTYGTAACGKILTPPYVAEIMRRTKDLKGHDWQAVIRCEVHDNEVLPEVIVVAAIGK